jgi:hypothetical protein
MADVPARVARLLRSSRRTRWLDPCTGSAQPARVVHEADPRLADPAAGKVPGHGPATVRPCGAVVSRRLLTGVRSDIATPDRNARWRAW